MLTRTATLELASPPAGELSLLLAVPNPLKGARPLRFANVEQDRDQAGWLTLGKIKVP